MSDQLTFEKLPSAVNELNNKVENLIQLISEQSTKKQLSEQEDKLLNVQETADFLDLTVPTIYSKASRGELPFMKQSKRIYFSKNDLMEYLREGRRRTFKEIEQAADDHLKKMEGK